MPIFQRILPTSSCIAASLVSQVRVGPGSVLVSHAKWSDIAPTVAAPGGDRHSPLYENLPSDLISIPELSEETLMEVCERLRVFIFILFIFFVYLFVLAC